MRVPVLRAAVAAAVLAPAVLLPASVAAQQEPAATERGAFVVLLGNDTIAVERYTRTGDRVEGEAVVRSPRTTLRRWRAELGPGGTVTRFVYDAERLDRSAPPTHAELAIGADTVRATLTAGGRDTTMQVPARGAMPFMYGTFGHYELAVRRALAAGGDSVVLQMVGVGQPEAVEMVVRRVGADSVAFNLYEPDAFRARVDGRGRILGVDGSATTSKVTVARVPDADVAALAAGWASRDSATGAMGVLSPLDSVRGTAGGAELVVTYSRPSLRGRELMGLLVPYDEVWRTGANAATLLRTSADVEIGGVRVPAGSYSLFTLPTRDGAELIVNRQVGQWGTEYDPAQDLARIPLTVGRTAAPVERFTFTIEPTADGALLRYEWGGVRWEAPVRPAR